jgi:hypothetical protein
MIGFLSEKEYPRSQSVVLAIADYLERSGFEIDHHSFRQAHDYCERVVGELPPPEEYHIPEWMD